MKTGKKEHMPTQARESESGGFHNVGDSPTRLSSKPTAEGNKECTLHNSQEA